MNSFVKRIIPAVCAAFLSLSAAGCSLTESEEIVTTVKTEVPPRMLFLGDSIPAGYGLDGYSEDDIYNCESYPNILAKRYKNELECDTVMINRSVSGMLSSELLENLKNGEYDAELKSSDAIVVSIGGNDILGSMFKLMEDIGYSPEDKTISTEDFDLVAASKTLFTMGGSVDKAIAAFDKNLAAIAEEIHSRSSGELFVQTLYDPLENFLGIDLIADFGKEKTDSFNLVVKSNSGVSFSSYRVADVGAAFEGRNTELTRIRDADIHPNEEGHKVIADVIDKEFRAAGFSYTVTEQGEEKLSAQGKKILIGAGIGCAGILLLCIAFAAGAKRR